MWRSEAEDWLHQMSNLSLGGTQTQEITWSQALIPTLRLNTASLPTIFITIRGYVRPVSNKDPLISMYLSRPRLNLGSSTSIGQISLRVAASVSASLVA